MGEVYKRVGQEPVRVQMEENGVVTGICFGHVVPARRGRHLSIPYGPLVTNMNDLPALMEELKKIARYYKCSFIRMSPFWENSQENQTTLKQLGTKPSPLHLLAEHLWLLPLAPSEDELFKAMRSTTRNLIRRAEKEGVTVTASDDPVRDLPHFLKLHDETRRRHGFTPYTNAFFRAQVEEFSANGNALLYLAHHQGNLLAASIHMQFGGETSYHHGASLMSKIPASYLLQWRAIQDAKKRGDHVYNFWGIAPPETPKHPFAGVTLFKTGFGGTSLELVHCADLPLSPAYHVTRMFENVRKWRRGF
jgi:lipid II:glycine glycyltransferase (peptidoglycan interpeptide bridge formation enzyme)